MNDQAGPRQVQVKVVSEFIHTRSIRRVQEHLEFSGIAGNHPVMNNDEVGLEVENAAPILSQFASVGGGSI